MHRNKSVSAHQFSMVPRADIPRSSFRMQKAYKTAFNGTSIFPWFCEEVLPGDTWRLRSTAFARLSTPLFPIMDNLHVDFFWFFVPNRLVWQNWERFMGSQDDPTDTIDYVIPQVVCPVGGYAIGSLFDYFGLPTVGQVNAAAQVSHSALPLRGYNLIYNQWFRDQNLEDSRPVPLGDGPDNVNDYVMMPRAKRHDYFTSCLPWPQKGGISVPLPLGTAAPVVPTVTGGVNNGPVFQGLSGNPASAGLQTRAGTADVDLNSGASAGVTSLRWQLPNLEADLSAATAATINELRQAFQIQRLLERDARGGTRYTEVIRAHFGVVSPDARLQRPEYLGGGSVRIAINPVAQTSATSADGTDTPLGNLAAVGTALADGQGFVQSFTEHGYVFGLMQCRADVTYQQGLRRHWSRSTRYDYYFPVFAHLGEQAVLSKEIYCDGTANDELVFGYQERWAEYRYLPSEITGIFRSTAANTVDPWHLAQRFTARPVLNNVFIRDATAPVLERVLAVNFAASGYQLLFDAFVDVMAARPMPLYSVPGLIDHL